MNTDICPISGETMQEERLNHWTHLFGLVLSLIGLPLLILLSSLHGDFWHIASYTVYGITLVLLYMASTYYHGCKTLPLKSTFRIVDHACIYLLIAGTYTPLMLGPLRDANGWTLLAIEWSIATVGILFKILAFERFQKLSLVAYLLMGWLIVFSWETVLEGLSFSTLSLIAAGGISYTLGTIFFLWESLAYNHAIWHLFVLVGSICHYFAVLTLLL